MPRRVLPATLFSCAVALAQDTTGGAAGQTDGANPLSPLDRAVRMLPSNEGARSLILSGRVVISGGSAPTERVRVQRICGANLVQEAYTDSQGRFTLYPDLSATGFPVPPSTDAGCELRASLQGYRSDAVPLGNRRGEEGSDVGAIVLHPISASQGLTVSATSALAPKEAQRSYEKGLEAIRHNEPDRAQAAFSAAVATYPRYAAAWFELGQVYERRGHRTEARNAYAKAIAADSDFLKPYERLYLLDMRESKWQAAADESSRVLHRDPYEFPGAYYVNALANLQLNHLDLAERSAREAGQILGKSVDPRANYVLGLVLAQQRRLPEAIDSLRAFLSTFPTGAEQKDAERILANLETRLRNRAARQKQ